MLKLSAVSLGSLAAQTLTDTSEPRLFGQVVSVFPHSLYIRTTKGALIFVSSGQVRSPISINVDSRTEFTQLIRPQDSAALRPNEIQLGEAASINMGRSVPFLAQTTCDGHQFGVTKHALCLGAMILMIVDNSKSILDPDGFAHEGASEFVSDELLAFRESNDVETLRSAALRIVGIGQGFTPSGDDMLGGFLATYNYFTPLTGRQAMSIELEALESKTSWISAKLLDYMQRCILDEQVSALLDSSASLKSDFILALETLLSRGHTSGIDILVGVLLALGIIHDIVQNDDSTTTIAKSLRLITQSRSI